MSVRRSARYDIMDNQGPLILIIDDEESLRDGCRQVLERSGYRVITAKEGIEGVRIAREQKPELAFIDLKIPGMSGMEIIEILRRDAPDIVPVDDHGLCIHCLCRGSHSEGCLRLSTQAF